VADAGQRAETVDAWHGEIEQDDVPLQAARLTDRLVPVRRGAADVEAVRAEQRAQVLARQRMVVDDHDAGSHPDSYRQRPFCRQGVSERRERLRGLAPERDAPRGAP